MNSFDDPIEKFDATIAAAHIAAYCDMLATLALQFDSIVHALQQKGLLSEADVTKSKSAVTPADYAKFSAAMQETMRNRIAEWAQELRSASRKPPS